MCIFNRNRLDKQLSINTLTLSLSDLMELAIYYKKLYLVVKLWINDMTILFRKL